MIKLFFVVGITILISTTLGLLILERLRLNNGKLEYAAPIGFAALLFGLQIFYYPIQLFNLSSIWIHIITGSIYFVLLVLSLMRLKGLIKQYLRLDTLWVLVYFAFFLYAFYNVSISIPRADGQMYLNYIAQNIDNNQLNNFNLWTGLVGEEFVTIYLFQGYFHFAGFLVKFVNLFSMLGIGSKIDTIVISMWGLGSLYALISGMFIINLANYIKVKSVWIKHMLIFFSLFFTNFYYWKLAFSFYGNTWRSLFMAMFLFTLYRLVKEDNRKCIVLSAVIFGASIAASSSSLFIGFSILLGVAYYFFYIKSNTAFEDASYIGFPMVIYVLALMYKDNFTIFIALLVFTLLYYGVHKLKKAKPFMLAFNQFIGKHANIIFIVILPLIAIVFSFIDMNLDPNYPWNLNHYFNNHANYDMVKNYLFLYSDWMDNGLNVLRWIGVLLLIMKINKDSGDEFLLRHFLILTVFFLNPLTTSFISKMFASNVYYRAFESLFNVFTEMLLFSIILNMLWNKGVLRVLVSSFLVIVVLYSQFDSLVLANPSSAYGYYVNEGKTVLPLYKIRSGELDVIKAFENEIVNLEPRDRQITVVSHADGLRTFTPNVYQVFTARQYWSSWDRIDQDFYQVARMWYGWEERPEGLDYTKSCSYLIKYKIDYVISEKWENFEFDNAINDCTEIIHENYEFNLRKVIQK